MSLATTIANALAIARRVTLPLHVTVELRQWIGQSPFGEDVYDDPVSLKALLNYETRSIKLTDDGNESTSHAYLAFLEPITPAVASAPFSRQNPIDKRDKITLPDGMTGPIMKTDGFANGDTGAPYFSQVWLGRLERTS